MWSAVFGSWQPTIIGIALAVATFLQGNGMHWPRDEAGWNSLVVAILFALLGISTKSVTVGSQAGDPPTPSRIAGALANSEPVSRADIAAASAAVKQVSKLSVLVFLIASVGALTFAGCGGGGGDGGNDNLGNVRADGDVSISEQRCVFGDGSFVEINVGDNSELNFCALNGGTITNRPNNDNPSTSTESTTTTTNNPPPAAG